MVDRERMGRRKHRWGKVDDHFHADHMPCDVKFDAVVRKSLTSMALGDSITKQRICRYVKSARKAGTSCKPASVSPTAWRPSPAIGRPHLSIGADGSGWRSCRCFRGSARTTTGLATRTSRQRTSRAASPPAGMKRYPCPTNNGWTSRGLRGRLRSVSCRPASGESGSSELVVEADRIFFEHQSVGSVAFAYTIEISLGPLSHQGVP